MMMASLICQYGTALQQCPTRLALAWMQCLTRSCVGTIERIAPKGLLVSQTQARGDLDDP